MIDDTKKEEVAEVIDAPEDAVVSEETVEAGAEAPVVNNLSIQDLAQLRNIINIASQRNAFKAEEFEIVGNAYNKLNNFITAIMPQLEAAKAAKDAEEGAEEGAAEVKDEAGE